MTQPSPLLNNGDTLSEDDYDQEYMSDPGTEYGSEPESIPEVQNQQGRQSQTQQPKREQKIFPLADRYKNETEVNAVQPFKRAESQRITPTGPVTRRQDMLDDKRSLQEDDKTQELQGSDQDSGLKLRLDLNLDIEVELKAQIHGDITLSLL